MRPFEIALIESSLRIERLLKDMIMLYIASMEPRANHLIKNTVITEQNNVQDKISAILKGLMQ